MSPSGVASAGRSLCRKQSVLILWCAAYCTCCPPSPVQMQEILLRTKQSVQGVTLKWLLMQGRNEEAMPLYKLISRHSAPHVARSAKRLLFGFTAGDYLKAHTITCVSPSVMFNHPRDDKILSATCMCLA